MVEAANTPLTKDRSEPFDSVDPNAQNWRGLWTLYLREVRRFGKVAMQTVVAPVILSVLYRGTGKSKYPRVPLPS